MDLNSILIIVGIVVLFGLAAVFAFLAFKVRGLINDLDTKVNPMLDDAKEKTEAMKPVVADVAPLMERVNVTLDALDVELVKVDGQLESLKGITSTVVGVGEAGSQAMSGAKDAIKSKLPKRG